MPIVKEFYFSTFVITIFSVFLLSTCLLSKCVECRYNHNAKFSLHAKMSVITLIVLL